MDKLLVNIGDPAHSPVLNLLVLRMDVNRFSICLIYRLSENSILILNSLDSLFNRLLMLKFIAICISLLILFSCQRSESEDYQTIEIDYENTEVIKVSDLFSDVRVIPLETREDYVIGRVVKVEKFGGYYYILDETNNQVCVHDSTGRYLSKLDKIGRGADEYIKLIDMQINKDGIWVLDYTHQAILLYSFEYDLLKKIRFKCFPANFRYADDKFYIYSELTGRKDDYCFYETAQNGKESQNFLLRDGKKKKAPTYKFTPSEFIYYLQYIIKKPQVLNCPRKVGQLISI